MSRADEPEVPDRPSHGTETMSFGRGSGATDPDLEPTDDHGSRQRGEVDAWYTEPDDHGDYAEGRTKEPSWLAGRWSRWTALDRDRRTVIVLIAVTVAALIVALVALTSRSDDAAIELPSVQSHGLDPDQAACFAYGLIEKRFAVQLGEDGFEQDPTEISGALNQEIQALDNLAADHPVADYQLITAFAAVADAGTALDDVDTLARYGTAVDERTDTVEKAARACDEVAGFDVDALEPR